MNGSPSSQPVQTRSERMSLMGGLQKSRHYDAYQRLALNIYNKHQSSEQIFRENWRRKKFVKTRTKFYTSTVIHVQQWGLTHENFSTLSSAPLEGVEERESDHNLFKQWLNVSLGKQWIKNNNNFDWRKVTTWADAHWEVVLYWMTRNSQKLE